MFIIGVQPTGVTSASGPKPVFGTRAARPPPQRDRALFPRLVDQRPDLAPVLVQLVQDHSMIEHLIGGLQRAVERKAPADEKLRHLDGIEAVMETHFRYEERRLLDVLNGISDEAVTTAELYGPLA